MSERNNERGLYLAADTPTVFLPVATESGGGDKKLLYESLNQLLSPREKDELIEILVKSEPMETLGEDELKDILKFSHPQPEHFCRCGAGYFGKNAAEGCCEQ